MDLFFLAPGGNELHQLAHFSAGYLTVTAPDGYTVLFAKRPEHQPVGRFGRPTVSVVHEDGGYGPVQY
tara:strand:- start:613 stop:816 length:204 start_codon:yes stop_codon:yes gene_type:complete